MSGWPSVVPMSPMPEFRALDALDADWEDIPDEVPEAMPAGPSGPAQPGVMTAVVAAITATGTAISPAARAKAPRRTTGRSARDGRHSSAAHPTTSPNSRTQLNTSSAPTDSAWCKSGPNGSPTVRDAAYTAMTMAFPAMPSHSQSRDGRQSRTAGHINWAHEITKKKAPYSAYSAKCSNTTAKWMAAAPTESAARPPSRYGRTVGGLVPASLSSRTEVLITPRLSSQSRAGIGQKGDSSSILRCTQGRGRTSPSRRCTRFDCPGPAAGARGQDHRITAVLGCRREARRRRHQCARRAGLAGLLAQTASRTVIIKTPKLAGDFVSLPVRPEFAAAWHWHGGWHGDAGG